MHLLHTRIASLGLLDLGTWDHQMWVLPSLGQPHRCVLRS